MKAIRAITKRGYNAVVSSILSSKNKQLLLDGMGNVVSDILETTINTASVSDIQSNILTPLVERSAELAEIGIAKLWLSIVKLFCKMQKEVHNRIILIREELILWALRY